MKKLIKIATAIALATTFTSAIAQYRFSYHLQGTLPQLGQNNGNGGEKLPETPKPSDGNYRCDADDGMGGTYYGQCVNGIFLGDDTQGNNLVGTCEKGNYTAHYDDLTFSGQCNATDSGYPIQEDTFVCHALDKYQNEITAQCSKGIFSGEDIYSNPLTGYCLNNFYTMIDKDSNVTNGFCKKLL